MKWNEREEELALCRQNDLMHREELDRLAREKRNSEHRIDSVSGTEYVC